jgi:hypothetical protein
MRAQLFSQTLFGRFCLTIDGLSIGFGDRLAFIGCSQSRRGDSRRRGCPAVRIRRGGRGGGKLRWLRLRRGQRRRELSRVPCCIVCGIRRAFSERLAYGICEWSSGKQSTPLNVGLKAALSMLCWAFGFVGLFLGRYPGSLNHKGLDFACACIG